MQRIKAFCLVMIILLIVYMFIKLFRKAKRCCRDSEMDPPRSARLWRKLPRFPRVMQVFPSPPSAETSRGLAEGSTKVSAPPCPPYLDTAAKHPGLTPQDLELWSSLATNSHSNIQRIIQTVKEGGQGSAASHSLPANSEVTPSMESVMNELQRDLAPGSGRPSSVPPKCPATSDTVQVTQADSATPPSVSPTRDTSSHPVPSGSNGGHRAERKSGVPESLARLRQIIENQ